MPIGLKSIRIGLKPFGLNEIQNVFPIRFETDLEMTRIRSD